MCVKTKKKFFKIWKTDAYSITDGLYVKTVKVSVLLDLNYYSHHLRLVFMFFKKFIKKLR